MSVTELLKLGSEGEVPDINRDSETYFLLTSLTSGQSAIITATARLELLLITMKVPFVAVDVATDERAKNLWRRRGNGKRLPVVVHDGVVLGNFEDLEQANEWGSLKQTLRLPEPPAPPPATIVRTPSIASMASVSTTASRKPSARPLPPSDPVPTPSVAVPTPLMQAAAQAAAVAAEKRRSNAFSIASSASSIRSVRSVASTMKQVSASKVDEPTPVVEAPAPQIEEPTVEVSAPEAEVPTVVEEIPAPKVRETTKTKATGGMRNRAPVPAAARRAPTSKTVAERAIKATARASIDEKRTSTSRPGSRASVRPESRASSLRPESRISVRPDSKAAKKTTMSGLQEKKAPSITARSVKSNSSSATVKPTDRSAKAGKKEKSKLDKLQKKEVK